MTARGLVGALIVAAGRSERMGGEIDKVLELIGGLPMIAHSISAFAGHPEIDQLVVVASEANSHAISSLVSDLGPNAHVVLGGRRRRDSVAAGLEILSNCRYVVIHDGARPLVTAELIDNALRGARENGAALCAVPVTDTVKRADDGNLVRSTVQRDGLWLAQTPQAFEMTLLLQAHAATDIDATDDAALVELLEAPVRIVMGSTRNIKVTTPPDLRLAQAIYAAGTD